MIGICVQTVKHWSVELNKYKGHNALCDRPSKYGRLKFNLWQRCEFGIERIGRPLVFVTSLVLEEIPNGSRRNKTISTQLVQ